MNSGEIAHLNLIAVAGGIYIRADNDPLPEIVFEQINKLNQEEK